MYKFLIAICLFISTPAIAQQLHVGDNTAAESSSPKIFSFLTWNLHKGKDFGFQQDFNHYADQYDFVATQEVFLNVFMLGLFNSWLGYEWHSVEAWSKNSVPTGVGTLSRVASQVQTPLLSAGEPFTGTAKSSLITHYQLNDGRLLMLINTHGLLMGSAQEYAQQLNDIVALAQNHKGPIIWAGDFNTWKGDRWDSFKSAQKSLALEHVQFKNDNRFKVLDHILYRDLKLQKAEIHSQINSSDHFPLEAVFAL